MRVPKKMMMLGNKLTYEQKLISIFGSSIISYLPLDDTAGATARDLSGNGRTGAYTGVALANAPGPNLGKNYPFWDGGNTDYVNWYSASLAAAFDGNEGSLLIWAKAQNIGMWSDGIYRRIVELGGGAQYVRISRHGATAGRLYVEHKCPTSALVNIDTGSPTAWFHVAITWSKIAGKVYVYFNGAQVGAPVSLVINSTITLVNTTTVIGASAITPTNCFSGWLGDAIILNRPATGVEIDEVYDMFQFPFELPAQFSAISLGAQYWGYTNDVISTDFFLLETSGARGAKILMDWSLIETSDGVFDWSKADVIFDQLDGRNIMPMLIILNTPAWARTGGDVTTLPDDPQDYADFCTALVNRYKNRGHFGAHLWQIGNEMNTIWFNASYANPHAYADLLKLAYPAIKAADPTATVILSSMLREGTPAGYEVHIVLCTYWLQKLYDDGCKDFFDVVAFHPYSYPDDPANVAPDGKDVGSNLIANPGFEVDASTWAATNATITRTTDDHHSGAACGELAATGGDRVYFQANPGKRACVPGDVFRVSCWVKAKVTPVSYNLRIEWHDSGYNYIDSSYWDQCEIPTDEWVQLGYWGTAPDGAAFGTLALKSVDPVDAGGTIYIDDIEHYVSSSQKHGWNWIEQVKAVMDANGDGSKQIWLTEWGQHTGTDSRAVDYATQALYVEHALVRARTFPYVGSVFVHTLRNPGTDLAEKGENMGLLEYDYDPKDAWATYLANK